MKDIPLSNDKGERRISDMAKDRNILHYNWTNLHIFRKQHFTDVCHLWAPNSNFTPGLLPILGAHGLFGVQGLKIKFYSGEFFLLGGSQTQNLIRGILPILGAHWGCLGFRGSKSNFTLGAFFLLESLPNSNFTAGL
jgi:hypothetical protein